MNKTLLIVLLLIASVFTAVAGIAPLDSIPASWKPYLAICGAIGTALTGSLGVIRGMATQRAKRAAKKSAEDVGTKSDSGFVVPECLVACGLFFLLLVLVIAAGCAALDAGEDPFVVRTEQSLQSAKGGFDFVLQTDDADRGFWQTNLPAFHEFCESLRVKQEAPLRNGGTTNIARCYAILLQVDKVKREYIAAKSATSSNVVFTTLLTLDSMLTQAKFWQTNLTAK